MSSSPCLQMDHRIWTTCFSWNIGNTCSGNVSRLLEIIRSVYTPGDWKLYDPLQTTPLMALDLPRKLSAPLVWDKILRNIILNGFVYAQLQNRAFDFSPAHSISTTFNGTLANHFIVLLWRAHGYCEHMSSHMSDDEIKMYDFFCTSHIGEKSISRQLSSAHEWIM